MPKYFKTDIAAEADLKVFVSDIRTDVDAVIFETTNEWEASAELTWYYADIQSDADKIIYFVDGKWNADISIFKTDIQSDTEWIDSSKASLL